MQWERHAQIFARTALTADGWQKDVLIAINESGAVASVTPGSGRPAHLPEYPLLLPGMSNVHSHAFQRAMAGLTETSSDNRDDNFWSWRQVMYLFKERLTPPQVETITRHLYIELLKQGYTAVGEFHYLHHDASGKAYADPAELSQRIITAARGSGIHLTLLPVYYESAGFGGISATDGQKRFVHNMDGFLRLMETLKSRAGDGMNLGIAPHSLRAVPEASLRELLAALPRLSMQDCPVHIHVSEQVKEVEDCLAWSGKRPVQWLLDNAPVDAHWCLIHATHADTQEITRIAASGAVVGLCPTTEANLGDGIFSAESHLAQNGAFGIGSDSNVCVSPFGELRQMEYAQRLATRRRAVLGSAQHASVGTNLYVRAARGGAQALGISAGAIAPGQRADLIALDTDTPLLAGKTPDQWLDTLVFIMQPPVTHVWVAGRCVVADGVHPQQEQSAAAWKQTLMDVLA